MMFLYIVKLTCPLTYTILILQYFNISLGFAPGKGGCLYEKDSLCIKSVFYGEKLVKSSYKERFRKEII